MKMIKNIIEYLIAISVIPAIVLTVVSVTELKDVRNVQYEILSEEEGVFNITTGTYEKIVANKRIKNYELESNYPLITQEEMERATWELGDLKNEIIIDENGEKRIVLQVGKVIIENARITQFYNDGVSIPKPINSLAYGRWSNVPATYYIEGYRIVTSRALESLYVIAKEGQTLEELQQELTGKPLYYELAVKNPNTMIIEGRDITITSDYVRIPKPNDFSGNPNGLLITGVFTYEYGYLIDKYEVTGNWIYVYPGSVTVEELASRMVGQTLYYELAKPRPVEVYDYSKFRLTYDKNRIRVVFDIDDEYYLWEITKDDKMIPINGQYDLGNIWTVKFYVYEIQQPLIRSLVLLIPLIVISGVLFYMYNMLKKKDLMY